MHRFRESQLSLNLYDFHAYASMPPVQDLLTTRRTTVPYRLTLLSSNIHYRYLPTKIAIILFKILLYESHNITLWFSQKCIQSWKSTNMIMPHCTIIIWPNCVIQVSTYLSNNMYLSHIKYYSPLDLPIPPLLPPLNPLLSPAPTIFLTFDSNQSPTHTYISLVPVLTIQKLLQFLPHILLFYVNNNKL